MKKIYRIKLNILLALLTVFTLFGMLFCAFPSVTPTFAEETTQAVILNNGSRLVANVEGTSYQWQIADTADGLYTDISGATGKYYDITAEDAGKHICVVVDGTQR